MASEDKHLGFPDEAHAKLLNEIRNLDGYKKQVLIKTKEINTDITDTPQAALGDFIGALKDSESYSSIRKDLGWVRSKQNVVKERLTQPQKDRIEREVAYDKAKEDVSKWDKVVQANKLADQLTFPLNQQRVSLHTSSEFIGRFQPQTPLEKEIAAVLQKNKPVLTQQEELDMMKVNLAEAREKRRERQKMRAVLSYQMAKARRQNKIKSKKYHRVLRKEKEKARQAEQEAVERDDPEEAARRVEEAERVRVKERATLRHRNQGKWAKRVLRHGKHDELGRTMVQDQLTLGKQLLEKKAAAVAEDSDEAESEEETVPGGPQDLDLTEEERSNPWMLAAVKRAPKAVLPGVENQPSPSESEKNGVPNASTSPAETSATGAQSQEKTRSAKQVRKQMAKLEKQKMKQRMKEVNAAEEAEQEAWRRRMEAEADADAGMMQSTRRRTRLEDFDDAALAEDEPTTSRGGEGFLALAPESDSEETSEPTSEDHTSSLTTAAGSNLGRKRKRFPESGGGDGEDVGGASSKKSKNAGSRKKKAKNDSGGGPETQPPGGAAENEGEMMIDVEDASRAEHRRNIAEAFADDDVVAEFEAEKRRVAEAERVKDVDMSLPGWGSWGGQGIRQSAAKRKKWIVKAPTGPPRKDAGIRHVIISERVNEKLAEHQVKALPYPFTNTAEFESTIKNPIGKTWNPETSFQELVKPPVVTKRGKVIGPITPEDAMLEEAKEEGKMPKISPDIPLNSKPTNTRKSSKNKNFPKKNGNSKGKKKVIVTKSPLRNSKLVKQSNKEKWNIKRNNI